MTSHNVVDQIRKLTGVKKVGHAGTLDPFATGVLVIMIGREATKRSLELMRVDKEYQATIEFGRTTDTLDPEGKFVGQSIKTKPGRQKLNQVLRSFVGSYQQEVPLYSATKVGGEKLYQKARRGETFKPPTKTVSVHELELREFGQSKDAFPQAKIRVVCSSGTYVRALARDVGKKLGVPAYLVALCRLRQGKYSISQAVSVPDLYSQIHQATTLLGTI